jgi:hypothetical protein
VITIFACKVTGIAAVLDNGSIRDVCATDLAIVRIPVDAFIAACIAAVLNYQSVCDIWTADITIICIVGKAFIATNAVT